MLTLIARSIANNKLLVSYQVGGRDAEYSLMLMDDLRGRLANRVQLTTDRHKAYLRAVQEEPMLITECWGSCMAVPSRSPEAERPYSATECVGAAKISTQHPDPTHISTNTSYTERANLIMRGTADHGGLPG
jgi:hypothetical protein